MDLSRLSTEDLRALQAGDLSKVSTEGLRYLQSQTPVKPETGLLAASKKGLRSLLSSSQTGIESVFGNEEDAARRGLHRSEQIQEQYPDQIGLDKIKDVYRREGLISAVGEVGREIPLAIAEQLPNIGAMAASGHAGAAIGSLIAPGIGTAIGAGLGAAVPSLVQQLGGNVERQAAEGKEDISVGRAAAAAVPQAALDVAGQYLVFGKAIVGKALGKRVSDLMEQGLKSEGEAAAQKALSQKLADETLFQTTRRGFVRGLAGEVPTEVAQQMLERAQAGLSLTDEDAMKEYADTAVQVGMLAPLGTAARFSEKSTAKRQIADQQAEELRIKAEAEKAAQDKAAADAAEAKRLKILEEQKSQPDYAPAQQAVTDLLKTKPDAAEGEIKEVIRASMGPKIKGDGRENDRKSKRTRKLYEQFQEHGVLPSAAAPEPAATPEAAAEETPFTFTPDAIQEVPSAGPAEEIQSAAPEVSKIEPTPPVQERPDEVAAAQPEQAPEPQPRADSGGMGAPVQPDVAPVGAVEVPDPTRVGVASVPVDANLGRKGSGNGPVAAQPEPVAQPKPAKPLKGSKRIQSLKDRLDKLEIAKVIHPDDARAIRESLDGRPVKKKVDKVERALGHSEALAQHLDAIEQAEQRGDLHKQDAIALQDQALGMDLFSKDAAEKLAAAADQLRQTREETLAQRQAAEQSAAQEAEAAAKKKVADQVADSDLKRIEAVEKANADLRAGEKATLQNKLNAALASGTISDKKAAKAQRAIDRMPNATPSRRQNAFLMALDKLRQKFTSPTERLMLAHLENKVWRAKSAEDFASVRQAIRDIQDPKASWSNPDLNEMRFDRATEEQVFPAGMPAVDVARVVRDALKGMKNLPKVTIRRKMDLLTRGYYDKKEGVVLNASTLRTASMVRAALFHELLGHYALRTKFGRELLQLLQQLYDTNPTLRTESDAWVQKHWMPGYPVYDSRVAAFKRAGLSDEAAAKRLQAEGRMLGVEETLADRAKAGPSTQPSLQSMWKQFVALVRDFARRIGMPVKFSDNDVAEIMRQAMDHVIKGGTNKDAPAGRAFSRKSSLNKAAERKQETVAEQEARRTKEIKKKEDRPTVASAAKKILLSHWWDNYEKLVTNFQNDRRPLVTLQNYLKLAGKLVTGVNDVWDQITRAPQEAHEQFSRRVLLPMNEAKRLIGEFAKKAGIEVERAMVRLDNYFMALHESERRAVKYVLNIPLDNQKLFNIAGLKGSRSAAGWRDYILDQIDSTKDLSSNGQAQQYRKLLDHLAANYYSATGESPMNAGRRNPAVLPQDPLSEVYNVIGDYDQAFLNDLRTQYNNDPNKALVDQLIEQLKTIQDQTIEMNRGARYWSQGTDNRKALYGFQHYVPFKGRPASQVSETDDQLELDAPKAITEAQLTQFAEAMGGRKSEADNILSQIFTDSAMAATRYGYRDVAETIKNLVGKGKPIRGKVFDGKNEQIEFKDRRKGISRSDLVTKNTILHYDSNGTITPIRIDDPRFMEAIKRSFELPNPLMKMVSDLTGFFGKMHTRYNPAFAPYNFVRDTLTNAGIIKAEGGSAGKYLKTVATQVSRFGFRKAWKVSKLYHEGRFAELDAMKDPFVKDIVEWLRHGGRSAYLQGVTNQGALEEFKKSLGKNRTLQTMDHVNRYFDMWGDSFEFLTRAAAYSAAKSDILNRLKSEGKDISSKSVMEQAAKEAAAYAKNLTNFESTGRWGKQAASLFMFFRPSATGAVRAIDSLLPALQSFDTVLRHAPAELRNDPAAVATMRKNHAARQATARTAIYTMLGAGASLYLLSVGMADGDDQDRNRADVDDTALWTRNIRLPIPGENAWVQMPWGFGLGAFGAMGAQITAWARGNQPPVKAMTNILHVSMDSFLPLPVSQIDPTENFFQWAFDSVMPSVVRPFFEYTVNMDALGRSIYNDRQSRYGDAFTGGDNVPEPYKQVARWMSSSFSDGYDVSPNTLYFWANNYADGLSRMAVSVAGLPSSLSGEKRFDVKHDLPGLSSFIGRNTSVDAREFASIKQQIEAKEARIRALSEKMGTDAFSAYVERHPEDMLLVQMYRQQVNGAMKSLQERKNMVNGMPSSQLSAKARRDMTDDLNTMINLYKRNVIDMAKDLGVTP